MKKLMLSAAILFSSLLFAQEQNAKPGPVDINKKVNDFSAGITKDCNLTPEQQAKTKPFITDFIKARTANKEKFAGDKDAKKAANKSAKESFEKNMQTVLKADQMKELLDYEKQQGEKMKNANSSKEGGAE
jgi:hypothetical protein